MVSMVWNRLRELQRNNIPLISTVIISEAGILQDILEKIFTAMVNPVVVTDAGIGTQ